MSKNIPHILRTSKNAQRISRISKNAQDSGDPCAEPKRQPRESSPYTPYGFPLGEGCTLIKPCQQTHNTHKRTNALCHACNNACINNASTTAHQQQATTLPFQQRINAHQQRAPTNAATRSNNPHTRTVNDAQTPVRSATQSCIQPGTARII